MPEWSKHDRTVRCIRITIAAMLSLIVHSTPAVAADTAAVHRLQVFAAASLTEVFRTLGTTFETAHPGVRVEFNFAGSSMLARQIIEGAPADVFASADEASMQKVSAAGAPRIFATNRLTIAVPAGNPRHIASLKDLTASGLTLAMAAPAVPAGRYAAEAFAKAGLMVPAGSQEVDVRAVLNKVALGEADAGIVYATDIRAAAGKVEAIAIPEQHNVVARYPIAVLAHAADPTEAQAFVDFVLSPAGQSVLQTSGFEPP